MTPEKADKIIKALNRALILEWWDRQFKLMNEDRNE